MCQANKGGWHSAEMMQNLTGLGVIPPAKRLNLNTDGFETFPRLLDLDLSAAMGKAKGNKVTEQNFHTCLKRGQPDRSSPVSHHEAGAESCKD